MTRALLAAVASLALIAGCGDEDAAGAGENLIETDLAEQIGLGELDASCDEPENGEVGTEFGCTATTRDARTVEFLAAFTSDDEMYVSPTNVVRAEEIDRLRAQAAAVAATRLGIALTPEHVVCPGEPPLLLETDGPGTAARIACSVDVDGGGASRPLVVTLSDYAVFEGYRNLVVELGEPTG